MNDLTAPSPDPIAKLLIVGGGSAGWMAAAMLSRVLGSATEITLVESEAVGIVGVGEATIPPIRQFNRFCGIDEAQFLSATQATFKTGIQFEGWGKPGDSYIHAFGRVGQELDAVVRMHHWWRMGQAADLPDYPRFEELYLGRAATDLQRFGIDTDRPGKLAQLLPHAYHFDAIAYGQFLRGLCEQRGVKRVEGMVASANRNAETGDLTGVTLEDGRVLEAELFIDCSGFRSLLLGDALNQPFEDWSHWLPSDRAVVVQSTPTSEKILPTTRAIAHPVGWQWRIPLQNRIGNGHVYASDFSSDEDAEARLLETIDGQVTTQPRILRFRTGRRKMAWSHNVIALGLAAGFLEPLESTSIHLVQSSIERLVELFPSRGTDPALRDRFNAQTEREWKQVRDLIIAHYTINQRDDSEFWKHCATMQIPDSLKETLQLWEENGQLAIDGGHLFQLGSWAQVLIGQNLLPKRVHPLTSRAEPDAIAARIRKLAASLRQEAEVLPDHAAFIRQFRNSEAN